MLETEKNKTPLFASGKKTSMSFAHQVTEHETSITTFIEQELKRQEESINLIASENYASPAVMKATGSVLTNKYAEGYPGARYYGGCEMVDKVENYTQDLGKQLFKSEHINVQPHSGSSANMAVYLSNLNPGDTVLGMSIAAGGHLTHGHKINFSGKIYNFVGYGVSPETECLDYDEIEVLADQHKPKMIVAGASAYSRTIDFARLRSIADSVGALLFIDMAHIAGLVATGMHASPVPYADIISSTTHKTLRGPRGGLIIGNGEHGTKIDKSVMPGSQGGPLMHVIAAKGIAFAEALTPEFAAYQKQIIANAQAMTHAFKELGYRIVSGKTDNHLFLVDLTSKFPVQGSVGNVTGQAAELTLEKCNISLNRNLIPFDTTSPLVTSGIRIGTPAITTRGLNENHCKEIVQFIDDALHKRDDDTALAGIKEKVLALCKEHPIY